MCSEEGWHARDRGTRCPVGRRGQGQVVDFLTEDAQVVVRYCGGANAGHTRSTARSTPPTCSPSASPARRQIWSATGSCSTRALFREIDGMTSGASISPANLKVSDKAHVMPSYHATRPGHRALPGKNRIGTTRRGIGPAYADKMHRVGIRVADLCTRSLKERLQAALDDRNQMLIKVYNRRAIG